MIAKVITAHPERFRHRTLFIFVPIHSMDVEVFYKICKTWSVSYFMATYLLIVWIQKATFF